MYVKIRLRGTSPCPNSAALTPNIVPMVDNGNYITAFRTGGVEKQQILLTKSIVTTVNCPY